MGPPSSSFSVPFISNSGVMKPVIEATLVVAVLLLLDVVAVHAQQQVNMQVPFSPSPTFDPAASGSVDSTRLERRLLNSAGAYLPGLGFKYPSFNQHDILRCCSLRW